MLAKSRLQCHGSAGCMQFTTCHQPTRGQPSWRTRNWCPACMPWPCTMTGRGTAPPLSCCDIRMPLQDGTDGISCPPAPAQQSSALPIKALGKGLAWPGIGMRVSAMGGATSLDTSPTPSSHAGAGSLARPSVRALVHALQLSTAAFYSHLHGGRPLPPAPRAHAQLAAGRASAQRVCGEPQFQRQITRVPILNRPGAPSRREEETMAASVACAP